MNNSRRMFFKVSAISLVAIASITMALTSIIASAEGETKSRSEKPIASAGWKIKKGKRIYDRDQKPARLLLDDDLLVPDYVQEIHKKQENLTEKERENILAERRQDAATASQDQSIMLDCYCYNYYDPVMCSGNKYQAELIKELKEAGLFLKAKKGK